MRPKLVLIAGRLCAGKTRLAEGLRAGRDGYQILSVREIISMSAGGGPLSRLALQRFGERLEKETYGEWLMEPVSDLLAAGESSVIVDAVRTVRQAELLRLLSRESVLLYLTASTQERRRRYGLRRSQLAGEPATLQEASTTEVEHAADQVRKMSDYVIDTTPLSPEEVVAMASRMIEERFLGHG